MSSQHIPKFEDGTIVKIAEFVWAGVRHAVTGSRQYYAWMGGLMLVLLSGLYTYGQTVQHGLIITSARHLTPWATLIYAQFPFWVGVAAGAVMIVIPAHLYHREDFESIVVLGEAMAVSAVIVSITSVLIMLGNLQRLIYIFPIPGLGSPNFPQSMLPWDVVALNGYLLLNIAIPSYVLYKTYHLEEPHPGLRYIIYMAIPWGISIHAVTAFIIVANAIRHLWYTALMIPRFLTSAFVAGPALLILILLGIRRIFDGSVSTGLEVEDRTLFTLGHMILIALLANFFSILSEIFTLGWPQTADWTTMEYLLFGIEHQGEVYNLLTPVMWMAIISEVVAILILLHPKTRYNLRTLPIGAGLAFIAIFLEKGVILFISVFIISPLGQFYEPSFTVPEVILAVHLWAIFAFIFTILVKASIGIRTEAKLRE